MGFLRRDRFGIKFVQMFRADIGPAYKSGHHGAFWASPPKKITKLSKLKYESLLISRFFFNVKPRSTNVKDPY